MPQTLRTSFAHLIRRRGRLRRCIAVSKFNMSNGHYVTYHTGTEASPSLQVDTALSARYLAVSDSTSVSHAIEKTSGQCIASMQTRTSLRCRIMLLAETTLARRLEEMSPIGNGSNEDVVQDWKDFIVSWGSHVIINSACGARFQLVSWRIDPWRFVAHP